MSTWPYWQCLCFNDNQLRAKFFCWLTFNKFEFFYIFPHIFHHFVNLSLCLLGCCLPRSDRGKRPWQKHSCCKVKIFITFNSFFYINILNNFTRGFGLNKHINFNHKIILTVRHPSNFWHQARNLSNTSVVYFKKRNHCNFEADGTEDYFVSSEYQHRGGNTTPQASNHEAEKCWECGDNLGTFSQ